MTDYLSNLPVELIDKILDNLPAIDIFTSLSLANKRLRLISLNYSGFQIDFSCLKNKKQFDIFCLYLSSISSHIKSISFKNRNDVTIPIKIDYFFSNLNIINNIFFNLRSLNLSPVDYNMWKSIKNYVKSLNSLVSLSLDMMNIDSHYDANNFVLQLLKDLLFMSPSLKYLCLRLIAVNNIYDINVAEEQTSSIEYLVLNNIYINLSRISSIAPILRILNTVIEPYALNDTVHFFRFEHLSQLSINVFGYLHFSMIKQLLHQMKGLIYLTIIAYSVSNDMSDGSAWEAILTNIITFKFIFKFNPRFWTDELISLESFSTPFWLTKKRWYIKYDQCINSKFLLLYTIPYIDDKYPWKCIEGSITTKSTGPHIVPFPNIDYVVISSNSSINTEVLCQFTELHQLFISDPDKTFNILLHNIVPHIDLSKMNSFSIKSFKSKLNGDVFVRLLSKMPRLRSISAPLTLLKLLFVDYWPNINHLEIYFNLSPIDITENQLTSDEMNTFFRSFDHIKYICFYNDHHLNIINLINNMPSTIFNIMIYHPVNVTAATFDRFITRDWLEYNTRLCDFFYSCDIFNTVNIWL